MYKLYKIWSNVHLLNSKTFLDTAIVDYILTIIIACGVTTHFVKIPLVLTTIILLIAGIIFHALFGIETNTLKYLGIVCK